METKKISRTKNSISQSKKANIKMKTTTLMKITIFTIVIMSLEANAQDIITGGSNSWRFYTPDDGRKSLYIAPKINSAWAWDKKTTFFNNGKVEFSGPISIKNNSNNNAASFSNFDHYQIMLWQNSTPQKSYGLGMEQSTLAFNSRSRYSFNILGKHHLTLNSSGLGIGTTNPRAKLDVIGAILAERILLDGLVQSKIDRTEKLYATLFADIKEVRTPKITIPDTGLNINYGSNEQLVEITRAETSIQNNLNVNGTLKINGQIFASESPLTRNNTNNSPLFDIYQPTNFNSRVFIGEQSLADRSVTGARLTVDGRVYISEEGGTEKGFQNQTSQNYKDFLLWVEEGIVSQDFAISETQHWPDYVFEADYKLGTLNELANFIKENGHLPNFPSAKEVEEKGFTVNDMTKRTVKTIEELTLHTLEQEKQINQQKKQIQLLMNRLEALESNVNK